MKKPIRVSTISFAAVLVAACISPCHGADASDASLIKQGEYLARAADCIACHTASGGKPFAGGLPISSPVGTIYSTNITPSAKFGIGLYTEQQFADAVREGIRKDGANLYAAMPYTSYSVLTDADVHSLYVYFMHGVAAVDTQTPRTVLPFPLSIRASMKFWNLLFLKNKAYQTDEKHSLEWNRGKYLVTGAAHCSTCHTPRGFLMQEESGLDLSGGQVGPWYAPNITPDHDSGIGALSHEDLVKYLRTGSVQGKAQAAGSMGEAVEHSFQYLNDGDLNAIATYLRTIPAVHDDADKGSRFGSGQASSELATLRGKTGVRTELGEPTGAELFQANCASCHSAQGEGSRDGYYPSLFHNSTVGSRNANNLIATILYGVSRKTEKKLAYMPAFSGPSAPSMLSDKDIVLLCNYLRRQYGSAGPPVTADQVAEVRNGGPASLLVTLARLGVIAPVVIVLIALGLWFVRRRRVSSGIETGVQGS